MTTECVPFSETLHTRKRMLRQWLAAATPDWWCLFGLVAAWLLAFVPADTLDEQVRYAGLLLQTFGIVAVAIGLSQTRRLFGRKPFWKSVRDWLIAFTHLVRRFKKVSASSSIHVDGFPRLVAQGAPAIESEMSLEERVARLEDDLRRQREALGALEAKLERERTERRADLHRERRQREEGVARLDRMLEALAIGGFHLEVAGVVWLLVGVWFGTVPLGLARMLAVVL